MCTLKHSKISIPFRYDLLHTYIHMYSKAAVLKLGDMSPWGNARFFNGMMCMDVSPIYSVFL